MTPVHCWQAARRSLLLFEPRKQMPVLIIVVAQLISSQDHLVGDRLCLTQPENAPRQALPAAERTPPSRQGPQTARPNGCPR